MIGMGASADFNCCYVSLLLNHHGICENAQSMARGKANAILLINERARVSVSVTGKSGAGEVGRASLAPRV